MLVFAWSASLIVYFYEPYSRQGERDGGYAGDGIFREAVWNGEIETGEGEVYGEYG